MVPSPAVLLLVMVTLASPTSSHTLPTLGLDSSPSNKAPTPTRKAGLRRRDGGTVCGYIGGDAALPATCIAGSHCALDVAHGVVGCCPDQGPCSTGVFTGCVDANSGLQTVADPYLFTCTAGHVCYRNVFDGGYYQFGCGTASRLATSVATSPPEGMDALALMRVTLAMTESVTPLATPLNVASLTSTASSSFSSSETTTTGSSGVGKAADDPSSTPPSGPASAPPRDPASPRTGAIVGGTIGGIAAMTALLALVVFLCRRHRRRPLKEALINSNNNNNNNNSSVNNERKPLAEDGIRPIPSSNPEPYHVNSAGKPSLVITSATPPRFANGGLDPHRIPLATGPLAFDSPRPAPRPDVEAETEASSAYPGPRRNGSGALWQQNRRQRRNLAWI